MTPDCSSSLNFKTNAAQMFCFNVARSQIFSSRDGWGYEVNILIIRVIESYRFCIGDLAGLGWTCWIYLAMCNH